MHLGEALVMVQGQSHEYTFQVCMHTSILEHLSPFTVGVPKKEFLELLFTNNIYMKQT
jgi:hypothetical protein